MVCSNQHNYCEECLDAVNRNRKCFECKETLLVRKRKNVLLCYILEKTLTEEQKQMQARAVEAG